MTKSKCEGWDAIMAKEGVADLLGKELTAQYEIETVRESTPKTKAGNADYKEYSLCGIVKSTGEHAFDFSIELVVDGDKITAKNKYFDG